MENPETSDYLSNFSVQKVHIVMITIDVLGDELKAKWLPRQT